MQDFEKLGMFYLGKVFDPAAGRVRDDLVLYDSRDLTTHAVCVGMTGSGKTGLGVALLEEAAIDGIPAIVIDPKGDLGNLLLTFPALQPGDFRPWIDAGEAARKGLTPDDYAVRTAEQWRAGLAEWGQAPGRIAKFRAAAEVAIYTPGSTAGRPLNILRSFAAPEGGVEADPSGLRDRILAAVSGLLGLLGVEADPVQSREHILLSNLLDRAWREGRDLDLPRLIGEIQKPPFEKVGVFDLETFYPARDRLGLAMRLNNLLASPGFSAWLEGEPLDIQRLLFTAEGRPRLAILSIAHLSDAERMFFVTLLLNETVAWMRRQSGTSSLRALLYMDEIFGYFPPTAMPPSKLPMLTLLKQARAYGLGVVLATQNPVDLDYKGLSNAGTWFVGRLQTERDKARVLEGLEGALASAPGGFDRAAMEQTISNLGPRVFLMRNAHEDAPVLFQTRWVLSYLRGPLTLPQLRTLTVAPPVPAPVAAPAPASAWPLPPPVPAGPAARPVLPPGVEEFFLAPAVGATTYRPALFGLARLHFVDAKAGIDAWETAGFVGIVPESALDEPWAEAERIDNPRASLKAEPRPGLGFAPAPDGLTATRTAAWKKELVSHIQQNVSVEVWTCPALNQTAAPGESEGDFRTRLALGLREKRDEAVENLRRKYAPKVSALQERLRRAEDRVARERAQYGQQKMQTAISVGATILGAIFGRKLASVGTVGRAATSMRSAGRIAGERDDVNRASESVEVVRQQLDGLQAEMEAEIARTGTEWGADRIALEQVAVRPRKSDIGVDAVAVLWRPV